MTKTERKTGERKSRWKGKERKEQVENKQEVKAGGGRTNKETKRKKRSRSFQDAELWRGGYVERCKAE